MKQFPDHPPALEMIREAIMSIQDVKGASLSVIKKYIQQHYGVNMEKYSPFVRRALVQAANKGSIIRVGNKGRGASGSFRLSLHKDSGRKQPSRLINNPVTKSVAIKKIKKHTLKTLADATKIEKTIHKGILHKSVKRTLAKVTLTGVKKMKRSHKKSAHKNAKIATKKTVAKAKK